MLKYVLTSVYVPVGCVQVCSDAAGDFPITSTTFFFINNNTDLLNTDSMMMYVLLSS